MYAGNLGYGIFGTRCYHHGVGLFLKHQLAGDGGMELHLHGKDPEAHVRHIAGEYGGRKQQVVQDRSGDVDEQVPVTDLHGSRMCAVDDRGEAQRLALVVIQIRVAGLIADDGAVLLLRSA